MTRSDGGARHVYEPAKGHGLRHDPFNAIVGPRPIGWISTVDGAGHANLAPYSFFNGFNYRPPIIGFSTIGWKDTVANVDGVMANSAVAKLVVNLGLLSQGVGAINGLG